MTTTNPKNTKESKPKTPRAPKAEKPPRKRITKKAFREALTASVVGGMTEEQREVIKAFEENPGALLGLSASEYQDMTKTAELIHAEGEDQELLVAAQALILCGLPYKPLLDESGRPMTHYKRTARTAKGTVSLIVAAADPDIPLPYGKDRAVLAWLQTKAKRQNNPTVTWNSASEFFKLFDLDEGGRQHTAFKDTWRRLGNAVFTIEVETDTRTKGRLIPLLEEWDLPTTKDRRKEASGQAHLPGFHYFVTLSPTLWKHLQESSVPMRLEVMRHFLNEPKAWDFVALICYRSWLCERSKNGGYPAIARISWKDLMEALGTVDKDERRLRTSLRQILLKLKKIWPECQTELERGGTLVIKPPINAIHPVKDR